MPLTCECPIGDFDEYYFDPEDYSTMPEFKRRKRCKSCGNLIDFESVVTQFKIVRSPLTDIESRIYGDDMDAVPLASRWFCEVCSDLYFSLKELGFCATPYEDMRALVKEYTEFGK